MPQYPSYGGGGGGGAVSSVFGRTAAVVAQDSDYSAFYDALGAATAATEPQALSVEQDATSHAGHIKAASLTSGLSPFTSVGVDSNGGNIANIATWSNPAPGQLHILNPQVIPNASGPYYTAHQFVTVYTVGGTAIVGYTGTGFDTNGNPVLTGCTLFSGSGTLQTGGKVFSYAGPIIDLIGPADSVGRGDGGTLGVTDWGTLLATTEANLVGAPPPGPGLVFPFYSDSFYGSLQWDTTTGASQSALGSPCTGAGGATPGSAAPTTTASVPVGTTISDSSHPFRRVIVYFMAVPNGDKIAIAVTGGTAPTLAAQDTHIQAAGCNGSTAVITNTAGFAGWAIGDIATVYTGTGVLPAGTTVLEIGATSLTLSAAPTTTLVNAVLTAQGLRSWDSADVGFYQAGTKLSVTASAHTNGAGGAGANIVAAGYMNVGINPATQAFGSVMYNIAKGGTQTGDWNSVNGAGFQAFLAMLANAGMPARRCHMMLGGNDQPGFFDASNTPATMGANLTALVNAVKLASPLTEPVLCAEYYFGTAADVGVGNSTWQNTWVPEILSVAEATGATYVDMHARFGNCSYRRTITDGQTTAGSNVVNSPAGANFQPNDVGGHLLHPAFPGGTTVISTYVSATQVTVSENADVTLTGQTMVIGGDQFQLTMDNGIHFGSVTAGVANAPSGFNGQQAHAELMFDKLAYSKDYALAGTSNTNVTATVGNTSPAIQASGTVFSPNPDQDCMFYVNSATTGATAVTMGPSTGTEITIGTVSATKCVIGFRVPATYKVKVTYGTTPAGYTMVPC